MRKTVIAAAAYALASVAAPGLGHAQQAPPPAERAHVYSPYELETISEVLASMNATLDPEPEGKIIERIDVVPLEVFEQRDPLPRVLNVLHATTRPSIVRREMLLREGDPYTQTLCDDTLRNLRHLVQLSLVLVVATPGGEPGKVRVVVITKDVWSLRLNWDVVVNAGGLEQLYLQPSEFNVAGIHHNASGTFVLEPSTYTLGLGYTIPRLGGTRVALQPSADIVVNRASGAPEGSFGDLVAGQPLYSGLADWAWAGDVGWQDFIARRYVNAAPTLYRDPATGLTTPFAYRSRGFGALYEVTRSIGWEVKHDVTFAASVSHSLYHAAFPSADARTVADFTATNVPVSNDTVGPSVTYHTYTKRYVRLLDFETLGLQEDALLGHEIVLSAQPSFEAIGGSYDVVRIYAAAQYSWALRDGYFRIAFASTTDFESDHIGNGAITPAARLVTPTLAGLGRLVADGLMLNRWRNELNITGACEGTHTQDADTSLATPFAPCTSFIGGSDRLTRLPDQSPRRQQGLRRLHPRAPVAPGRDLLAPAGRHALLRRGGSRPRARQLPYLSVRRGRVSRHLPVARSRGVSRGYRLPARASARPEHGSTRASVRLPHFLRPGVWRAERIGNLRPADRTSLVVNA